MEHIKLNPKKSFKNIIADFPILQNNNITYLDSAASAQKPYQVINCIKDIYSNSYANVHRGVYSLSQVATDQYEDSREVVKSFINAKKLSEIIFVRGATEAINLVAEIIGVASLNEGDEIILSRLEHHSNIVPWQIVCKKTGAIIKVAEADDNGNISLETIKELINKNTKIISITHISNAIGTVVPVKEICKEAKKQGIITLIDGCQAVPQMPVDVQDIGCDFYVFSGHKTYGPSGVGVLYGREELLSEAPPYQSGGDMIDKVSFAKTTYADLPSKYEAGTPNIVGVIGLGEALKWMNSIGMGQIYDHSQKLLDEGIKVLSGLEGLKIIGNPYNRGGVISFIYKDFHAHDVGTLLNTYNIAIRTGHHCAQPTMERYKLSTTARASIGIYNSIQDFEVLADGLLKVNKIFNKV